MSPVQLAAVLGTLVFLASIIPVDLGVTVALIELTLGVVADNVFELHSHGWLDFIAKFASIVLTFLAGMEVDPEYMRDRAKATLAIGVTSFAGPFATTALALSAIFIKPNVWFPVFLAVSVALIVVLPRIAAPFFERYGDRVIEPEIKLAFDLSFTSLRSRSGLAPPALASVGGRRVELFGALWLSGAAWPRHRRRGLSPSQSVAAATAVV